MPPIVLLRRFIKKASAPNGGNRNAKLNNSIVTLVQKIEANARCVEEKRRGLTFAPNKLEEVESFSKGLEWEKSPLGNYVVQQRKVREERRKILADAARAEKEKEAKKRNQEGTETQVT